MQIVCCFIVQNQTRLSDYIATLFTNFVLSNLVQCVNPYMVKMLTNIPPGCASTEP